jgi:deoxyribonuclease-4
MPGTMPHRSPPSIAAPAPRPALPDGRPLGAHLPLADGMVRAVERAHAIGADALQVFADNPTAWKRRAEPPAELGDFRARIAELGIGPIAVHASYLVNLAGPSDELYERSIALLAHEMGAAPGYGARFVNVHVGSHKGAGLAFGIARVAAGIARVLDAGSGSPDGPLLAGPGSPDGPLLAGPGSPDGPLLVLENSAGSGGGIGVTIEELERILEAAEARGVPAGRLGVCLDTAHLWAAGYDLATADGVDAVVDEVAARIGLDRLVMIHLNDSKAARGSNLDRHQHLGAGEMGPGAGLARLLTHPALARVASYLETPGMDEGYDAVNVARARDLAAGRPLAPLPREALHLRGARARTPAPA